MSAWEGSAAQNAAENAKHKPTPKQLERFADMAKMVSEQFGTPAEDAPVLALCEKYGFGAVMGSASRQWRARDPVGAIAMGECYGATPAPSQPQEAGDRPLPDLPSAPRPGDWDELASLRKWQEDAAATFDQIMRMADAGTWATFGDVINAVQGLVIAEASDPAPIPCAVPGCSRANHKFEAPSQAAPIGRECWVLFDAEHVAKRVRVIGESGFLNIPGWKWVRMVEAPPIPPRAAPIWGGAFQDAIKAYQEWRRLKAWAMGADTSKAWQDVDDAQGEFHRRMGEAIALPAVPPHAGGWDLAPMAPLREAVKAALDAWNEWVIDTDQQAPSHDWLDAMSDLEIAYAQDGDGSGKPVAGADTPSEGK